MSINFPDKLEHNNPNYPIVDATDVAGTFWRISGTLDNTNLLALPETKRGLSQVVFSVADNRSYEYLGGDVIDVEWGNVDNWNVLGSVTATFRDSAISTTVSKLDVDGVINMINTVARTVTLPSDATENIPVGKSGIIVRKDTGTVQIIPDTGVTIEAIGDYISARYIAVSWIKSASNTFQVWGALS